MNKATHLMWHCASTPEGVWFEGKHILHWHMLPFLMPDGQLKYKGKVYANAGLLPNETVGGLPINKYFGSHGWSRPGYDKVFLTNGAVEKIWKNNEDGIIEDFEITNGILKSDPLYSTTIHWVQIGGMDRTNKIPKDTRTKPLLDSSARETKRLISLIPDIKVIGHNQINFRACPSFNVPVWCRSIGIAEKNIDDRPLMYKL